MKDLDTICNDIMNYKCEYENDDFLSMYNTPNDIFKRYYILMENNSKGVLDEISEDIHTMLLFDNLDSIKTQNRFDCACKLAKELNSYIKNNDKEYVEENLANDLVDYAKNFDTYDYRDIYKNDEDAYNDMLSSLSKEKIDTTLNWLGEDILILATDKDLTDPEMEKLTNQAFNLLCRVNQYRSSLEKEKKEEMDIE